MIQVAKPSLSNPYFKPYEYDHQLKVFLGGTIDMGNSADWQSKIITYFDRYHSEMDILFMNPRRNDWDSSWKQDPREGTKFYDQVKWEQTAQSHADVLIYYFADGSMSPITLLELGAYGGADDTIVHVTPKYQRYGNVVMHCNEAGIEHTENVSDIYDFILETY